LISQILQQHQWLYQLRYESMKHNDTSTFQLMWLKTKWTLSIFFDRSNSEF
jgi:hypothetical protein